MLVFLKKKKGAQTQFLMAMQYLRNKNRKVITLLAKSISSLADLLVTGPVPFGV
jgi:hypothetical protein